MTPNHRHVELLRQIVENLRFPERLEAHPWADSLGVQAASEDASLRSKSRGVQLALTVGTIFRQTMPATPPRHDGKRLDTRWGRFGILAANYFAPLLYGRLYPNSLRDAWRRIDPAIYLFVYGKPLESLKPEQVKAYEFLGDEPDLPANSTISDWHRDGLQELADRFLDRERSLSLALGKPSTILDTQGRLPNPTRTSRRLSWRLVVYAGLAALVALLALGAFKAHRIYSLLLPLTQDLAAVTGLDAESLETGDLQQFGSLLERTRSHLAALRSEVTPFIGLTRSLRWIPIYGGDLKYAEDLLAIATEVTDAAYRIYDVIVPIWDAVRLQPDMRAPQLTQMLIEAQPALRDAKATLGNALASRRRIADSELSPHTRELLHRLDPYLTSLDRGLSVGLSVPGLLGATNTGPKTYLILVQNEDELRATGGFITAVGKAVVWNGELMDLAIRDSYDVDDINKAYPPAPWQMQGFMNIPIMVFRDANWFSDFPTAVRWAEYLYAYTNSHSVDGVVAIDQHVLEQVLAVTGPIRVGELGITVNARDLRSVMRAQKIPPPADQRDPDWHRKKFMNPISAAILQRVLSGKGFSWEKLLREMMDELDGRHISVQMDDPVLSALLAQRGWDGALRSAGGDYLMVVDTNVGYNKTNAVVSSRLVYDVDLTDVRSPHSTIAIFHQNAAEGDGDTCNQRPPALDTDAVETWYAINRCYYDYLRVYVSAGAQLEAATPHAVTQQEMVMLEADVPARVDLLDETLEGIQGFGTLLVVPLQGSLATELRFALPPGVLQPGQDSGQFVYALKIQKQPGTVNVPLTLRVHLPRGASVLAAIPGPSQRGPDLLFDLELSTDVRVQIEFRP